MLHASDNLFEKKKFTILYMYKVHLCTAVHIQSTVPGVENQLPNKNCPCTK
jgi:hypothetical protein